jgi:hypothetical protein
MNIPAQYATIGKLRKDGDFDVIAAINSHQFNDDGQMLAAIYAVIRAGIADSEAVILLERQDVVDVLSCV